MDWAYDKWYVRYLTGLSGNSALLGLVDKPRRRAENDYAKAHRMKHTVFKDTGVERFTMDSLIKRIMLSAVYITERKTFIRVSFPPHHRHLGGIKDAMRRMAA